MLEQDYIRRNEEKLEFEALAEDVEDFDIEVGKTRLGRAFKVLLILPVLLILGIVTHLFMSESSISISSEDSVKLASAPMAATAVKTGTISIPAGTVKANPFLPYKELKSKSTSDIPTYSLVEPPDELSEVSTAARLMDTIVSGILYDKFSPSAILNIEGNDYLVKKGDVVNNYKIVNIMPDSVTVKLGENVYKAGIGEILTEGSLNHNVVSNLDNKFGGVR